MSKHLPCERVLDRRSRRYYTPQSAIAEIQRLEDALDQERQLRRAARESQAAEMTRDENSRGLVIVNNERTSNDQTEEAR